jgi:glucosamine-6-phosphate deaminase
MAKLELVVVDDAAALSRVAADLVHEAIREAPAAAVLAATGSTPMGTYRELATRAARGSFDASRLRVFQLDEYVGIDEHDGRSLLGWLLRSFVRPLGLPDDRVVRLPGDAADLALACRRYDHAVAEAGGIDLAILGLGPNGHLGFNEPPSDPSSPTRAVALSPASVASSAAYWGDPQAVPRRAITAGMTVLGAARRTILVVSGTRKHEILRRTVEGEVTPEVPASFLQRQDGVVVVTDRSAWTGKVSLG